MNKRYANHTVITSSGAVHYASDSHRRPAHILSCNGRSVDGLVGSLALPSLLPSLTCKACIAGQASGRIGIVLQSSVPDPSAHLDELRRQTLMTGPTFRTNADGTAVCAHRDLSVCDECAKDEAIVEVVGAHYYVPNPADRDELRSMLAGSLA